MSWCRTEPCSSEKLINWTLSSRNRRMEVNVGVAYGNDPEAVLALLLKVTRACSGVATEPEPGAFFSGSGKFARFQRARLDQPAQRVGADA